MLRIGLCLALAVLAAGCGSRYKQTLGKVEMIKGKVVNSNGQPISSGRITFRPLGKLGPEGWADLQKDGTFQFREGGGVPAGKYLVTFGGDPPKMELDPDTVQVTDGTNEFRFTAKNK
jgi:hypothetical protein